MSRIKSLDKTGPSSIQIDGASTESWEAPNILGVYLLSFTFSSLPFAEDGNPGFSFSGLPSHIPFWSLGK